MGSVPGWLLRHYTLIEAYRGWNDYDTAVSRKCFVQQRLASAGPTGTERVAQYTVIYPPATDVPAGSRITLADGRVGYAAAVAHHDGGGLPTPDHVEVAVSLAAAYGPAFGETVTVLRRTRIPGPGGSSRYTTTEVDYPGAGVRPLTDADSATGASGQLVVETIEVILPPGAEVATTDQIRVRGLVYDVDGVAQAINSSTSDAEPGVKVIGKRRQ